MARTIKRFITLIGFAITLAAVVEQLNRPPPDRTWHGTLLGFIPYEFRPPTLSRVRERLWNPDDERILTPHIFGVGWSINLYQLQKRLLAPARTNGDG